ncbi:SpoIIE family protein phosphatase [Urbifossiella limnaea]|uniref:Phosphoserine phosphatase RsbU n=1 Tax=Urbifossiella limnaea TaxID=2528023 RepID=A0A517XY55_9BACT|nr:SpoIIE family protein phosphatase [Urbifossiella limnaea]QDU22421.1 Phosphoserine phosphatase RsbU [Urbifossiella limnaea]
MPALVLLKSPTGGTPGDRIPLDGDLIVLGRDAETCQIVLPHHAISRRHAQISRANGHYYVEDLKSRNETVLNGRKVTARTQLRAEDRLKLCDFLFKYEDERARSADKPPLPEHFTRDADDEPDSSGATTIEATGSRINAQHFLDTQPNDRLRALLDISTSLSRTLDLDPLLNQVAETMLKEFKQADRCFIILLDDAGRMVPRAVRVRRGDPEEARFSRTIIRKAVDTQHSYLSEDASADASLPANASIAEFKIRSVMCVPLVTAEGKSLGAIQLDTQDRSKKFREDDLNLLTIVANLAGVAVEKAKLHENALNAEKAKKEMELARAVQLGFLPQSMPTVDGYEFFAHYSPAQTIGGDYYDAVVLPNGRLAVVLGDVAGKGVPAALLVAKLSSEVRFCLLSEPDPVKAVGMLNDQMISGGLGDRFVTLAVMLIDTVAHQMTVVNAGHMNPRMFRVGPHDLDDAISTDQTGTPLGVMPGYEYESVTLRLEVGDVVAVFTDGVTDAMSPSGALYGPEGVDECLLPPNDAIAAANWRPRRVGDQLVTAVKRHAAGRAQNDDIAVIVFGRVDPAHGPVTNTTRTDPKAPALRPS